MRITVESHGRAAPEVCQDLPRIVEKRPVSPATLLKQANASPRPPYRREFCKWLYSLSGKWLELLKQIAPGVTRVAVLRDAAVSIGPVQFGVIQAVAPSLRMEVNPVNMRDAGEIERAVAAFARSSNGGLIVPASGSAQRHRDLIITLAARHKLPAVYWEGLFVAAGGLISFGPNEVEQYRQAAGYVDRILKGEKPADLPVQAPTKYELVINLKTAKALGLTVPDSLLARADEVIE